MVEAATTIVEEGAAAPVCSRTGLSLSPSNAGNGFRIAKSSYGPLNPRVPRESEEDRRDWGRFDVPGKTTVYAGLPEQASYAECLAALKVDPKLVELEMRDLFDVRIGRGRSVIDVIKEEWADLHHMAPTKVPQGWRAERLLYTLARPATGWFVRLDTAESISVLDHELRPFLASLGIGRLTTADLAGENRLLTTTIASWVHQQILGDGSLPHGIEYSSKHGANWRCWAIWLRRKDDNLKGEPTRANSGVPILPPDQNPPLSEVASLFNLQIH